MFNALLAHTPWKLRPEDVEVLMRGEDTWSQVQDERMIMVVVVVVGGGGG